MLDDDGDINHDERMFFHKSKGAFRAGGTSNSNWNEASLGTSSAAFGYATAAAGEYSFAFGYNNMVYSYAEGALAFGYRSQARGDYSVAAGYQTRTEATADYSTAWGKGVYNDQAESFMVGFKVPAGIPYPPTTDPGLFVNSSNNVGIGTSAVSAGLRLNVAGKVGATEYCDESGANCTAAASLGGSGGGAPTTASYVVIGLDGDLSNERTLVGGTGVSVSDGGAGGNVTITNTLGDTISSAEIINGTITYSDTNTNSIQRRVVGTCSAGYAIRAIDSAGNVTCEYDDSGSSGDNLGNHSATQNLDMNTRDVREVNNMYVRDIRPHGVSEIDVYEDFDMNYYSLRNVDTIEIATGGYIYGESSPLSIATNLELGGQLDMNYHWIRDGYVKHGWCTWTSGSGNMSCNDGYFMAGADAANDWISIKCCRL